MPFKDSPLNTRKLVLRFAVIIGMVGCFLGLVWLMMA